MKARAVIFSVLFLLFASACKPSAAEAAQGETLVILGFPASADGSPSPLMKLRLDKALKRYSEAGTKAVITTGGAVYNRFPEAEVMRDYLIKKRRPGQQDHHRDARPLHIRECLLHRENHQE